MSIALEEVKNVEGRHDRLNLVLLKYVANRSSFENREYKRLKTRYPDNEVFESGLMEILRKRRLVTLVNAEVEQDENGDFHYTDKQARGGFVGTAYSGKQLECAEDIPFANSGERRNERRR